MRIGFFVHAYHPSVGGIESFAQGLAKLARQLGHDVFVFTPLRGADPRSETLEGIEIRRVPMGRKWWPGLPHAVTPGMAKLATDLGIEISHGFEYRNGPPIVAAHLRKRQKIPFVWSTAFHPHHKGFREPPFRRVYDMTLGRSIARSADVIAFLSAAELAALERVHPGVAGKRKIQLPPVIGDEFMAATASSVPIGIGDEPYVLFLGRNEPYKGAHLVVKALHRMENPPRFVVAGPSSPTDERPLRKLAQTLGVQDRVQLIGRVTNAEKRFLLSNAAVVLNPSNYESFGITIIEGICLGRPVLTTPTGIAREVVWSKDQLLESTDPATFATKLEALVSGTAEVRQMSPAAVIANFGPNRIRRQLSAAYQLALQVDSTR